jgi:30S ribosomal protein S31
MGKGDDRTRRGKLFKGTFGKRRPKKKPAKPKPAQGAPS